MMRYIFVLFYSKLYFILTYYFIYIMQFWHRVKIIKSIIHNNVTIREELHKDRQYFKCSIFNPR